MNIETASLTMDMFGSVIALWKESEGVGLSDSDSPECIRLYLDRNPGFSFAVMAEGEIIGAILGGHDGRRGFLYHLAVRADFRRRGLGRRLVEACLGALAESGIRKCHVFVYSDNRDGMAFWKSLGWNSRKDIGVTSISIEGRPCGEERKDW